MRTIGYLIGAVAMLIGGHIIKFAKWIDHLLYPKQKSALKAPFNFST